MYYDVMGRVFKTSNPTETSAIGTPFQWLTTVTTRTPDGSIPNKPTIGKAVRW
jgi:hypothetical protein